MPIAEPVRSSVARKMRWWALWWTPGIIAAFTLIAAACGGTASADLAGESAQPTVEPAPLAKDPITQDKEPTPTSVQALAPMATATSVVSPTPLVEVGA